MAACRRLREQHYEGRVPLSTEQVWPDLFHIFANGGWTIGPKLLKEHLNSVVIVECFIVCGHALSAKTFGAIQARVK